MVNGMIMAGYLWNRKLMSRFQIVKVEEPFLVSAFGNAYVEYKKKVNRYLGRRH